MLCHHVLLGNIFVRFVKICMISVRRTLLICALYFNLFKWWVASREILQINSNLTNLISYDALLSCLFGKHICQICKDLYDFCPKDTPLCALYFNLFKWWVASREISQINSNLTNQFKSYMCRSSGTLITIRHATHTGSRPTRVYARAYGMSSLRDLRHHACWRE